MPVPVAPSVGLGAPGVDGGAVIVVNDQTAPLVAPLVLCATTCQKYVVPLVSVPVAYDALDRPVETSGGGLVVPKLTS